jgi:hypothetical protein
MKGLRKNASATHDMHTLRIDMAEPGDEESPPRINRMLVAEDEMQVSNA